MSKVGGVTPMMAQYMGLKADHPDAILLFRMGDFYETFYDDARRIATILGITLTSREKKGDEPIPLAGVPHHAVEHYLAKLLDAGLTVAICEQVEDPATAKGLVRREVVEVISPGTVTNPSLLRGDDGAFLLALLPAPAPESWGYALLDGSTGEFRCGEALAEEALGLSRRYRVGEILLPDPAPEGTRRRVEIDEAGAPLTEVSALLFEPEFAAAQLQDHFGVQGLEGLGVGDLPRAVGAAGAALRYLADRQRTQPHQVTHLVVDRPEDRLHLDRETVAHLELFEGLRGPDRETTLFHHLCDTRTPMGRRRLAAWLRSPLTDPDAIDRRLDAVQWLHEETPRLDALRAQLKGVGDLERVVGRVATGRVLPHELAQLRAGLLRLPELAELLAAEDRPPELDALCVAAPAVQEASAELQRVIVDEPPTHLRGGGVLRSGVDATLDELREMSSGGKAWIAGYQERERERTQIGSLKVGYNKVFGYYLEVTNPHLSKVPDDYQEKQTLTSCRRFITAALKEREDQILRAESDRVAREATLFGEFVGRLAEHRGALGTAVEALGRLDAFASLAAVARARRYVRPVVDDGDVLFVEGGRHPVVERLVGEPFVPNDLRMDNRERQLLLLTGPNMGGKSTYLRQAALFVVMAQMGSFVPAEHARIGVVDRLFTRVGASDNLARGQSTFLVEMSETANILRNATDRSLVILDEVGRGTSTDDGLALAHAITEYLHDGPLRPKTLFATHFHELTALVQGLDRAENIQMQVKEWEGRILFLHRVVSGASDRSYGVHVAELAGLPRSVLERASELLDARPAERTPRKGPPPAAPSPQLPLFRGREAEVLERLRHVDADQLRPLDALRILAELSERLRGS